MREPRRIDGYAPIGDYGVIGNERTAALVGLDGSIDYLCLPRFDSPAPFSALLDSRQGGRFELAPTVPFRASRRYLPGTNVLETTFETAEGKARVTDAMSIPLTGPMAWEEIVRKVEGLSGTVPMRWRVAPRFGWGARRGESIEREGGTAIRDGDISLLVRCWDVGEHSCREGEAWAEFETAEGSSGMVVLASHPRQPWLLDDRESHEQRLADTCEYWRRWLEGCRYEGPWREEVERSALALAMLVHSPSGAMMAAATTSLPEAIGGSRNFDYRYCWLRDTAFVLEAMLQLGRIDQVHATLTWLLRVVESTSPQLAPFYGIDGSPKAAQDELELDGYRGSRPVHIGNNAGNQLQLGNYGDLLQAATMFVEDGNSLGPGAGHLLGQALDFLCRVWRNPDSSIWELPEKCEYLQGKLAAWLAFDCGVRLAERGELDGAAARWEGERAQVERFIEERCWSDERGAYVFHTGTQGLDASTLLMSRTRYFGGHEKRLEATVGAIRDELGAGGPLLYRYSGMQDEEGAFVACSFWLIETLARLGRRDEAAELMDDMVGRASDLGLFSEEIDPGSGELLGNLPQALSHLALINAAFALTGSVPTG
jgi:GH15 family glucan-1,4-alpha-glucosidase